jgi:hypothetical protein
MGQESIETTQKYLHEDTVGATKAVKQLNKRKAKDQAGKLHLVA